MLYQLSYTPKPAALPLLKRAGLRKWQAGNRCDPIAYCRKAGLGSLGAGEPCAWRVNRGISMNKLLVVAALVASSFAVPVLPASAASTLSDAEANCLIFPMFKKECWEMGAAHAKAATASVAMATEEAADDVKLPLWWNCTRAPAGSGHLLDCD